MSQQTYIIRNYQPPDFDEYVNLHIEAEKIDQSGLCTSRQTLREYLGRPLYDPGKDLFIAESSGKISSFLNITPELIKRRVLLDCLVHPRHRRKSLATQLLGQATQRARELEVEVMHVNVLEENTAAREVLSRLGFSIVRQFLEMSLPLSEAKLPETSIGEFTQRYLQHGEEERLANLQNRCFADTWGFNPNAPEEISYALNLIGASPDDVVLINDGVRPVAYCWTKTDCLESPQTGVEKGRVFMLGVDPDYRGRGIGKLALRAGLNHLKDKRIKVAELTVDGENLAAFSLYKSFDFKVTARSLYYEKKVD
jgi:mycothiol synthase